MCADLQQTDYNLVYIADGEVPLAPSFIKENYFLPMTIAVMLTIFLVTIAVIYVTECRKYRSRIAYLCGSKKSLSTGWNLMRLKEEVKEMELEAAGLSGGI